MSFLFFLFLCLVVTKQKTFNGTETLNCPSYENKEEKKKKTLNGDSFFIRTIKLFGLKKREGSRKKQTV